MGLVVYFCVWFCSLLFSLLVGCWFVACWVIGFGCYVWFWLGLYGCCLVVMSWCLKYVQFVDLAWLIWLLVWVCLVGWLLLVYLYWDVV